MKDTFFDDFELNQLADAGTACEEAKSSDRQKGQTSKIIWARGTGNFS